MRQALALAVLFCGLAVTSVAAAQVVVVEENEVAEEQVVERGYVRGVGRGIQYGAHIISPVYLTHVYRTGTDGRFPEDTLEIGGGAGLHARIGWEFPSGFTFELFGGFAANENQVRDAALDSSRVVVRADFGGGARYNFFNDSALVPFVGIGVQGSWFRFDWPTNDTGREVGFSGTLGLNGLVGLQIELSPYFGIEAGCAVDYMFAADIFGEGLLSIRPFLGVTLYVYDEND